MIYTHKLVPMPGRLAVIRERVSEAIKRAEDAKLSVPDDVRQFEQMVNPWALVVGVGEDLPNRPPTKLRAGQKVLISEVGRTVPLQSGERVENVYVLPFEGVLAILNWECPKCGAVYETEPPLPTDGRCPQCQVVLSPHGTTTLSEENLKALAGRMR